MRVSFIAGLTEDFIFFECNAMVTGSAGGNNVAGIGYDSTTAATGKKLWGTGSTTIFGQPSTRNHN